jgi:hypothetical protein
MSDFAISGILLACILVGLFVGMSLRKIVPDHHLSSDSRETVKLGTGLVGTMAALVLGLMVASAKSSFDTKKGEVVSMCANVLLLDRLLANYGPEARETREVLRRTVNGAIDRLWSEGANSPTSMPTSPMAEELYLKVHQLPVTNDTQRQLAGQAQSILNDLSRTRMLLFQQKVSSISTPFLIVVTFWVTIMFLSFGLFAPKNGTVLIALLICALSVSCAILLILELDSPFDGLIQIPKSRVLDTMALLGR